MNVRNGFPAAPTRRPGEPPRRFEGTVPTGRSSYLDTHPGLAAKGGAGVWHAGPDGRLTAGPLPADTPPAYQRASRRPECPFHDICASVVRGMTARLN